MFSTPFSRHAGACPRLAEARVHVSLDGAGGGGRDAQRVGGPVRGTRSSAVRWTDVRRGSATGVLEDATVARRAVSWRHRAAELDNAGTERRAWLARVRSARRRRGLDGAYDRQRDHRHTEHRPGEPRRHGRELVERRASGPEPPREPRERGDAAALAPDALDHGRGRHRSPPSPFSARSSAAASSASHPSDVARSCRPTRASAAAASGSAAAAGEGRGGAGEFCPNSARRRGSGHLAAPERTTPTSGPWSFCCGSPADRRSVVGQ